MQFLAMPRTLRRFQKTLRLPTMILYVLSALQIEGQKKTRIFITANHGQGPVSVNCFQLFNTLKWPLLILVELLSTSTLILHQHLEKNFHYIQSFLPNVTV